MTFSVRLQAGAQRDVRRALAHYDAEAPEQTARFVDEFESVAMRLARFPYSGPQLRAGARTVNLRVFPYQLWYRVDEEARMILIIAVLHHRQDSTRFNGRIT